MVVNTPSSAEDVAQCEEGYSPDLCVHTQLTLRAVYSCLQNPLLLCLQ